MPWNFSTPKLIIYVGVCIALMPVGGSLRRYTTVKKPKSYLSRAVTNKGSFESPESQDIQ